MKTPILFLSMAFTTASFAEQMPEPNPPFVIKQQLNQRITQQQTSKSKPKEWIFHKTADGRHPSNKEQSMVWLMNRARQNPSAEGVFLANTGDSDVENAINYFHVDIDKLQAEFAEYAPRPPAAFDVRLYKAALAHSKDLIVRDAQDHNNQFDRINNAGFNYMAARGSVFSYAESALYGHAGFNIDWGNEADGMQTGRGHRSAIMSLDVDYYSNVGIAILSDNDPNTNVGPLVVTGNYAQANDNTPNHYNRFIVGTVWRDKNNNSMYDIGEGLGNVQVRPHGGTYWAKTAQSGGYAIPITSAGSYSVSFSGGQLKTKQTLSVTVADDSILMDLKLTQ